MPGEGNPEQALYWQTSGDGGLTWSPPVTPLPPITGPSGQQLPMWSPVLHTQVPAHPILHRRRHERD